MSIKREISASVANLHEFKRLALSSDRSQEMKMDSSDSEDQHVTNTRINVHSSVTSVMSHANVNFEEQYQCLGEIGRGGFSTVYQCRNRNNNQIYAVKVRFNLSYINLVSGADYNDFSLYRS